MELALLLETLFRRVVHLGDGSTTRIDDDDDDDEDNNANTLSPMWRKPIYSPIHWRWQSQP